MAANTTIGISDPSIARQFERQTTSALTPTVTGPATVSTSGTATSNATTSVRSTAPVVSGSEVIYPQAVTTIAAAQAANSVTITQSANNESGDITTVYSTPGTISVTSVDQRVNQYSVFNTGVSEIIAGNNITISATIANGKGEVTINSTGGNGDYSNSNVASYLPTYTGNVSANWILGDYISGNANPLFHIPQGNLVGVDGNASNVLYGNGVFAAAPGGGGGGLPLANGNSNINIATANGPVTLTSAGQTWTVGTDGSLTAPNNSNIYPAGNNFNVYAPVAGAIQFYTDGGNFNWSLDGYGVMNLPFASAMSNTALIYSAGNLRLDAGANNFMFTDTGTVVFPTITVDLHNGGNQYAQTLQFGDDTQQAVITGPTPAANVNAQRLIIQGQRGNGTGEGGDVYFWAGDADTNGGDIKIYAGDADNVSAGYGGYINLDGGSGYDGGGQISVTGGYSANGPGGTVNISAGQGGSDGGAININGGSATANQGGNIALQGGYGGNNGGEVRLTGGSAGTGIPGYGNVVLVSGASTWTFDNTGVVSAGGNFKLAPDSANTGSYLDIFLTSGPDLHLVASAAANLILGKDAGPNVMTSWDGNVYVQSWDTGSNTQGGVWNFGGDGNLILAGGNSVIQSIANSSLDPLNPNVSTMTLTPDANYSSQVLVLDPTAPGHIHLRALSFGNIDDPAANIFLGGEATSFEITYGSNNEARVHSNNHTWTFGNDGTLLLPRDAVGNTDPYLWITGGNAPSISSVDVSLAGPANFQIVSDYLNLSGYSGAKVAIKADNGEIATDANMVLTTNAANVGNEFSWTFATDGSLTLPGNLVAVNASPAPVISGFSSVSALQFTNGNSNVTINANSNTWTFDSTGNLIIPSTSGGVIKTVANGAIAIAVIDNGTDNPAQLLSINANGTPTTAVSSYANEATIQANINGSIQTWAFTNAGVVTSPVLTYANLSAATTAGRRAFISDANLAAAGNFGNAVSGGGANTVPVYSDGSVWRIG